MYVQYGCALSAPVEWRNFDASPTLRFERIPIAGKLYTKNAVRFPSNVEPGDIVKGLPIPNDSCDGVYCSHVLEHLALQDFHAALDHTLRIMKPNAVFRLVVPDLEWAAREYVAALDRGSSEASLNFLHETLLGRQRRARSLPAFIKGFLGASEHLWMWDALSLTQALLDHGFTRVRRCQHGDSGDPMFRLVESEDRFQHAVALEARR